LEFDGQRIKQYWGPYIAEVVGNKIKQSYTKQAFNPNDFEKKKATCLSP